MLRDRCSQSLGFHIKATGLASDKVWNQPQTSQNFAVIPAPLPRSCRESPAQPPRLSRTWSKRTQGLTRFLRLSLPSEMISDPLGRCHLHAECPELPTPQTELGLSCSTALAAAPRIHPRGGFLPGKSWRNEEPQTQLLLDRQTPTQLQIAVLVRAAGSALSSSHSPLTAISSWNVFLSPWGTK